MKQLNNLLDECMENIYIDESIKSKIVNVNIDENSISKNVKTQRKKVIIRRVWKNIVSVAACIIALVSVASVGTYALTGKSIFQKFFDNSEPSYAKELLDYNGQQYVIDDYTITLESTLYDSKSGLGYCVFAITMEGGKPDATMYDEGYGDGFGENDRFVIRVRGKGKGDSFSSRFEYVGNVLYQYYSFTTTSDEFVIRVLDGNNLNPNRTEEDDEYLMHYDFEIAKTNKCKQYIVAEGKTIAISPLGICIETEGGVSGTTEIILCYSNGDKKTVVNTEKKIGIGLSETSFDGEMSVDRFKFEELVGIEGVDYIIYNGERYNATN